MKTQTSNKILDFIATNERVTAKSIIEHVGFSPPAVFRQLAKLLKNDAIKKQGTPPKVFYSLTQPSITKTNYNFDPKVIAVINEKYIKITSDGILQSGVSAFISWCLVRGLDPIQTSLDYINVINKFDAYKNNGLINGLPKLKNTFPISHLDKLFYLDFYSIERFGKTKLGELILYAKQSQNISLIKKIVQEVREQILQTIKNLKIDAVGFVPPTVKRDVQFMKELERLLHLPVRLIKITKIKTPIIVPQKTLSKIEERILNAQQSLIVEDAGNYKNILLIDDAVGSGATINEVARQIKQKNLASGEIIGLALTGSFSGFEVIHEV